jgi:hypothetical protein
VAIDSGDLEIYDPVFSEDGFLIYSVIARKALA